MLGDLKVVVTGGSGFIGNVVVAALRAEGAAVTVADRNAYADAAVPTLLGDLTAAGAAERAVPAGTEAVVHLAAITSVLRSVQQPSAVHQANVEVTADLLERCREVGVDRFVLASTNAVVGDAAGTTIDERTPLAPLTPYGGTKAAAEMLLSAYAASYDISGCALRFSNVYGPGMAAKDSFIARLMRAALAGDEVEIYGDGEQRRDLVHVRDVARGVTLALAGGWRGPVIIGSQESVSVNHLVELVREVTGRPLPARHTPAKPGEMRAVTLDCSRAHGLGWEPSEALRDGLAEVWEEFRQAAAVR